MEIDLYKVKELDRDAKDLTGYINDQFEKYGPNDPPVLSDLIVNEQKGGLQVLQALEAKRDLDRDLPPEHRYRWRLQVIRDEWGNPPVPGEDVVLKITKKLEYAPGKPLTTKDINADKAAGVYEEKWIRKIPYRIDNKGCISVEYEHAAMMLRNWGIHYKTNRGGPPLSMHMREHSEEPAPAPDGNKLHVWYWRFKEVDAATYKKLPDIKPDKKDKRGITIEA